jgi:hypothetical protein
LAGAICHRHAVLGSERGSAAMGERPDARWSRIVGQATGRHQDGLLNPLGKLSMSTKLIKRVDQDQALIRALGNPAPRGSGVRSPDSRSTLIVETL